MAAAPLVIAFLALLALARIGYADDKPPQIDSPLIPRQSLEHFQLHPDLSIELVAAEPQVVDPVAMAFDEHGRLWVVEMRDYPNGPGGSPSEPAKDVPGTSTIRLLTDPDDDGFYEESTVFADGLLFPTGILPWQQGVIVTLAGEIAYFEDTDGDGTSDVKQTWFHGFAQENPQLRANHPTLGLDGRVYVANGLRGGTVTANAAVWGEEWPAIELRGKDFRFDPHTGEPEALSGAGQFGLTFDDAGNRFVCSNRNPCMHVVLEDRDLQRNPHLAVSAVRHDVSPAGAASKVFPVSEAWTTSNLHAGQFTAACGVTIYRGDALPQAFYGNSFTCEPTGNLVHRDVLSPQGPTFTSKPGREGVEFLASPDTWFRPVNLAHGPDGALYVVDMHRAVIEHPKWVPSELKHRPDERLGDDRGRIYRIVPNSWKRRSTVAPFGDEPMWNPQRLVRSLAHPNGWHRNTAHRLLAQSRPKAAVELLRMNVRGGFHPRTSTHGLWLLKTLDALDDSSIEAGLTSADVHVRMQALRAAASRLRKSTDLTALAVEGLTRDDPVDAFHTALALDAKSEPARRTLADLAVRHARDPWVTTAALVSLAGDEQAVLERLDEDPPPASEALADLVRRVCEVLGSRDDPQDVRQLAARFLRGDGDWPVAWENAALQGLADGLRRRRQSLRDLVKPLLDDERLRAGFDETVSRLVERARNDTRPVSERREAIRLLGVLGSRDDLEPVEQLAISSANTEVRVTAIQTVVERGSTAVLDHLLERFPGESPAIRDTVLDVMLRSKPLTGMLLDEIEGPTLKVAELDARHVRALTRHRDAGIRKRAGELLAAAIPADRKQVLADYRQVLSMEGDPLRGRKVFEKNCAQCHRIGDVGVNVGPDVSDSRTKTPEEILVAVLQPNRAIDNDYLSYTVVTTDGRTHNGLVTAETASSITLRQPKGETTVLLRSEIELLKSNGVSLMPEGLEKNVDHQQMADLIAFVKNWRYLDGRVPVDVPGGR